MTAPTHKQAKRIFWRDMKSLCPKWAITRILEGDLTIRLFNGAEITVLGMDAPDRIEGRSIDGVVCDEQGNMKPEVFNENIRPCLSSLGRPGWAWLIGVPEGRNHYYQAFKQASRGEDPEWSAHTWFSSEILDPKEIAQLKKDMDLLTYQQEFEGAFIDFSGRAYYAFGDHNIAPVQYCPREPLIFCFDFNTAPGVAVIVQEQTREWHEEEIGPLPAGIPEEFTAIIGEVWIERHSNTERVCAKLVEDWSHHKDDILLYGDATGGAKGTAAVEGSDWDLIESAMERGFPGQWRNMVANANPRERVRVNAVNSRCQSVDKTVALLCSSKYALKTVEDLEGVTTLEGTNGQLDKESDKTATHLTDALGYYIEDEFPIGGARIEVYT
ncbi:MAG: hypothetical protein IID05_04890 [Gemmatimonadetes bacterium]|nr:hypothetical protein [Gemmatimonadota bacterium]